MDDAGMKQMEHWRWRYTHRAVDRRQQIKISVINSGPITSVNSTALDVRQTLTVDIVRGDRRKGSHGALTKIGCGNEFDKPVDNIGEKSSRFG